MKTYKTQVEKLRLVIEYDPDAETPRAWDNIGLFITKEGRYKSPDGNTSELYQIMLETEDEAENTEHHIKLIKARAAEAFKQSAPKDGNSHDESLHVIDIYPVYRYEHGNVYYKRGTAQGFDYSNCGFYIVTAQGLSGGTFTDEDIKKNIDAELETYSQWCNGEIYQFALYDESGELEDSCGGFYDIEDIREYLPEDWEKEDLTQYLKN